MNQQLEDYSSHEIEANAHLPVHMTHHLHIPRGCDAEKLVDKISKDAMDQVRRGRMDNDEMREIERGQQFIGYNFLR